MSSKFLYLYWYDFLKVIPYALLTYPVPCFSHLIEFHAILSTINDFLLRKGYADNLQLLTLFPPLFDGTLKLPEIDIEEDPVTLHPTSAEIILLLAPYFALTVVDTDLT